jgi:dTDP-glucose 4,6-dehydratase
VRSLAGLRAVVTGGAGFVGSWTCQRLVESGAEVVCVDNLATGCRENVAALEASPRFMFRQLDITDGLAVDGRVDWVLHLASPASPVHYLRLPIETLTVGSLGTRHALELAARKRARFVLTSTSEVYGDPLEHPQRETYWGNVNPVGPRSVYDEAKRFAEALTTAYRTHRKVRTGIARLFNTYGPRLSQDDGRAVATFIDQALAGDPITVAGDGSQTRSLCFVDDTVEGILALADSDVSEPVNLGSDAELTVAELAIRIRDLAGSASEIVQVERPTDDPQVRRPDLTRSRELLGWRPRVSLDEGLRRTLQWARQSPPEQRAAS